MVSKDRTFSSASLIFFSAKYTCKSVGVGIIIIIRSVYSATLDDKQRNILLRIDKLSSGREGEREERGRGEREDCPVHGQLLKSGL